MSIKYLKSYEAVFLVNHWVNWFKITGNINDLSERGLSHATTLKENKVFLHLFQTNPSLTLRQTQVKPHTKRVYILLNTIRSCLHENDVGTHDFSDLRQKKD
ncbi:hypothetical protein ALC60_01986 [Trachymyrmex zeteki]|uniref:Uncharacterized protein n=1 Tax=Mycetomoellerius zeteki TaxID=64791 RepID=A0A151XF29_9HYME|nr:hypothetical protein ALC60_01986 [Trachymyrmex zeteki]